MRFDTVLWDLSDDPDGNVMHIAEHGITQDEWEQALLDAPRLETSRSTGRPVAFGYTHAGRHLIVVFERIDDDTIYPVTAYDVED